MSISTNTEYNHDMQSLNEGELRYFFLQVYVYNLSYILRG